jgi:hypothetical protein
MAVIDGRSWLERLSQKDCWELLASTPVAASGDPHPPTAERLSG